MNILNLPVEILSKILGAGSLLDRVRFGSCSKKSLGIFFQVNFEISCASLEKMDSFIEVVPRFACLKSIELPNNQEIASKILPYLIQKTQNPLENIAFLSTATTQRKSKIENALLDEVAKITSLRSLNLQGSSRLSDDGIKKLTALQKLEELNLFGCFDLTDNILPSLSTFSALTKLSLGGCWRITPNGFISFQPTTTLKTLDISYCSSLTSQAIQELIRKIPQVITAVGNSSQ